MPVSRNPPKLISLGRVASSTRSLSDLGARMHGLSTIFRLMAALRRVNTVFCTQTSRYNGGETGRDRRGTQTRYFDAPRTPDAECTDGIILSRSGSVPQHQQDIETFNITPRNRIPTTGGTIILDLSIEMRRGDASNFIFVAYNMYNSRFSAG